MYQPTLVTNDDDSDTSDDQPTPSRLDPTSLPEQIDSILDNLDAEDVSREDYKMLLKVGWF